MVRSDLGYINEDAIRCVLATVNMLIDPTNDIIDEVAEVTEDDALYGLIYLMVSLDMTIF